MIKANLKQTNIKGWHMEKCLEVSQVCNSWVLSQTPPNWTEYEHGWEKVAFLGSDLSSRRFRKQKSSRQYWQVSRSAFTNQKTWDSKITISSFFFLPARPYPSSFPDLHLFYFLFSFFFLPLLLLFFLPPDLLSFMFCLISSHSAAKGPSLVDLFRKTDHLSATTAGYLWRAATPAKVLDPPLDATFPWIRLKQLTAKSHLTARAFIHFASWSNTHKAITSQCIMQKI